MSNLALGNFLPTSSNKPSWADAAEEADESQYDDQPQQRQPSQPRREQPQRTYNDSQSRQPQQYDNRRPQYDDRRPSNDDRRPQYDNRRPQYDDRQSDRRPQGQYNDRRPQREDRVSGGGGGDFAPREYTPVPLPDQAPWKAYFGNLPFDISEDEIVRFCDPGVVLKVVFPRDREGNPRGTAFVEFETLEDLKNVIEQYNGHNLAGRAVRIDAAKPRDDTGRPRQQYNSAAPSGSDGRRVRHDSQHSDAPQIERRQRRTSDKTIPERDLTEEEKAARPKLALKPRTATEKPASPSQVSKSDIFGGARPREAVLAERPTPASAAAESKSPEDAAAPAPTPSGNTVKILTSPVLAPQSDAKSNTYKAKQPTLQSLQRDRQLASDKRTARPSDSSKNGERNGGSGKQQQQRDFKPVGRQNDNEPVLKATNAFAGLDLDDEDN